MTPTRIIRGLAVLLAAVSVQTAIAPAEATVAGRNGRIAFTSGREPGSDDQARIHTIGPVTQPGLTPAAITPPGGQSRHPTWSPDRTKLVYANGTFTGDPKTEEYDLFLIDFVNNTITPLDGNELADGKSSDHPAWSPDGTRIAYETQVVDNDANREIAVKTVGTSRRADILTNSNQTELKPAWSPDSQTLYYAKQNGGQGANSNFDIVKQPAGGGVETPVAAATGVDEYQPSISPDGTQMCFTLQTSPGNTSTADIYTASLPGLAPLTNVSDDPMKGDINCVWSPDGKRIAFTNGVFGQGRLVMVNSDDSSAFPLQLADDQGSNNFDGNADWAPDGSPECPDTTITTQRDTPVTIPLECTDTGPAYERTDPKGFVTVAPQDGTTSDDSPQTDPSTVRYTPKPGFTGTDTLRYTAFDDYGFGTDDGTVTIRVEGPAGGDGGNGGDGGDGGDGGQADRTPPVVSRVSLRPRVLRIARGRRVARRPSVLRFHSSEAGRTTLHFRRLARGRRYSKALRRNTRAGVNRLRVSGRIGRRTLPAGRYRLTLTVRDAAGNKSRSVVRRLTVIR